MSVSDYYIAQWEEEFGEDETFSCEWFSGCADCGESGWMELMEYDQDTGDHYCDYCFEKRKDENENYIF